MNITVCNAVGYGSTELSAFDNALFKVGTTNFNLIRLSSVIPPASNILIGSPYLANINDFGNRLYCVYAEMRSSIPNTAIGAIVGYYQFDDGRGLFVEHELAGKSEKQVEKDLIHLVTDSLSDLCQTRGLTANKNNFKWLCQTATVENSPTCALVMAVYKVEKW